MAITIKIRRDTAANWTSADPVLAIGEQGFETDTRKVKIGDGTTAWTGLDYIASTAAAHASNHATGGSDPLTPADIGAVPDTRTINGLPLTNDIVVGAIGGFQSKFFFCDDNMSTGGVGQATIGGVTANWHELESTPDSTTVAAHQSAATSSSTPVELDRYLMPASGHTSLEGGEWSFSLWAHISGGTGGPSGQLVVDLYRVAADGTLYGAAFASGSTATFTHTAAALVNASIFAAEQSTWLATDFVGVVVSSKRIAGNNVQITFTHDKTAGKVGSVTTPQILHHNDMVGLNQGDYQHLTAAEKTAATAVQAAGTASIRAIGTGATDAAAGNHTHTPADLRKTGGASLDATGVALIEAATAAAAREALLAAACSPAEYYAREDFIGYNSASGTMGELGWYSYYAGGGTGATVNAPATALPNLGIKGIVTGNASGASHVLYLMTANTLLASTNWAAVFVARLASTADCDMICGFTTDNAAVGVGKYGSTSFGIRYSSARDTYFTRYCKKTDSDFAADNANNWGAASSVAADTSWHTFRIRSTSAGAVEVSIDGGAYASISMVSSTGNWLPFFYSGTRTTASKTVQADFFSFRATGLAR